MAPGDYSFQYPLNGHNFGPGFQFSIGREPGGTLNTADVWELELTGFLTNQPLTRFRKQTPGPIGPITGIMGYWNEIPELLVAQPRDGSQPVTLIARQILSSTAAVQNQLVEQVQYSDSGQFSLLSTTGSGTGGFTATDRENLTITKAAVWRDDGAEAGLGIPIISQIIDLVRGPPRALQVVRGSLLLSDSGTISPVSAPDGLPAFGAQWKFNNVPDGFGYTAGRLKDYSNRMAQFAVYLQDTGGLPYVDQLVDVHTEDGVLLWKWPPPVRIEYTIAPGVILQWLWLR